MDEKGLSESSVVMSQENSDSLCPMFFGVSCALFALRGLTGSEMFDEKWSEVRNTMLRGSAHLLGLLVWRIQNEEIKRRKFKLLHELENAQREIEELKRIRREDGKANEKVVSIFASQEQSWFKERRKIQQQIGALMNELRVTEVKKDRTISELNGKLQENEVQLQSRDKSVEEEKQKRKETEEKLKKAEKLVEELRDAAKHDAQRHNSEISKHKTAFIELVSNQRQLEAEMGRALRQAEAVKQELESAFKQNEHSVLMTQKQSGELVKMRKDLEQKDQILSAMLRKSKLDAAEKQVLVKEMKFSKAKKKQAELESARWKAVSESRHERYSLRNMLSKHTNQKLESFPSGKGIFANLETGKPRSEQPGHLLEPLHLQFSDPDLTDARTQPKFKADVQHLESWVLAEAEKYKIAVEQRHHLEIDAFAEQLRLKEEKLEDLRWRLLSMELESKRLRSHIDGLDHELSQLRQDNVKLEALVANREAELESLKEKLALKLNSRNFQETNAISSLNDVIISRDTIWSKVKVIKRKPGQKGQGTKMMAEETPEGVKHEREIETCAEKQPKDMIFTIHPQKEKGDGKVISLEPEFFPQERSSQDVVNVEKSTLLVEGTSGKNYTWKMDLHALGVSYKIKRLKQQLLMLERLTGKRESCKNSENNNKEHFGIKGFYALMCLLSKQVDRYQSLQGKTDELCKQMHENDLDLNAGCSSVARSGEETKLLEHFLEETFQLQRYIVATGQKLMEVQSRIASSFISTTEGIEKPDSFDMKRFADGFRTLLREVQRGLEVRIARIIGDLGGTLACDGMTNFKK